MLSSPHDLHVVFDVVSNTLAKAGVECLLVGGFAVNYYGYTRNTLDVDWMIVVEQRHRVQDVLKRAGFTDMAVHETVMFFQRPGTACRVDFLHADPDTFKELLSRAVSVVVHGVSVKVPMLKDLIAMKLFSLAQNPERRMGKDLPDIVHLTLFNKLDLEQDIHPLAARYASEAIYKMVSDQIKAFTS
jgi:predicted nucleotidyltransferase